MLPRVPDTMMVIMYADLIGNYKNLWIKSHKDNISEAFLKSLQLLQLILITVVQNPE